jgi:RNA polymerase sigma-70 factor (ECF subfamily)
MSVSVSIDGTAATHDGLRGVRGSHAAALRPIASLTEAAATGTDGRTFLTGRPRFRAHRSISWSILSGESFLEERSSDTSTLVASNEGFDLAAFHAGDRRTVELCYREHYAVVARAARQILPQADAETVTHEVFLRLLTSEEMRASFRGGDFGAWIARVAKNRAIDHHRRYSREEPLPDHVEEPERPPDDPPDYTTLDADAVVRRFREECLPPKYAAVFEARFMKQLAQREAAAALKMPRSTLMYQEHRIRTMLRRFVLKDRNPRPPS